MFSKKALFFYVPLLLILTVAIFVRFLWLDKVPNAIGGDEIVYVLNAKSLFLSGHDIFGSWSPVNGLLFQYPKGEVQSELPYLLYAPIVGILPFSLFSAHLTNALLGILLVLFTYLVASELLDKKSGLFAALVASINPWFIYMGRTAYEAIPAMLFYLISLYVLLKVKGWRILIAFPFLALAFYSYIATKLVLLPFVFVVAIYCYLYVNKKKYLKQYVVLFLLCVLLVLFYFVSLKLNPNTSRLGELISLNDPSISKQVDDIRKVSIQNPLTNILVNKYSIFINIIIVKTIKTFASDYLFISGDEFFSIYRHGLFYYIDSVFLVLGSLFVFNKKRAVFFLLAVLTLLGTIPQVLHTADIDNFTIHITMMFPFMIILIGFGIWEAINFFKNKNLKIVSLTVILILYIISASNFLNIYFYQWSLKGYFDFPVRVASNYAIRSNPNEQITIYSNSSYDYFKKYLFYTNLLNKDTYLSVRNNVNQKEYGLGNVTFKGCDSSLNLEKLKNQVIISQAKCAFINNSQPHVSVANLSDGGETFVIFNDNLCKNFSLGRYPRITSLSSFDIESLSDKSFCQSFIMSL